MDHENSILTILARAIEDPVFQERLFSDAEAVADEMDLSETERAPLTHLTRQAFYRLVGAIAVPLALPIRVTQRCIVIPAGRQITLQPGEIGVILDQFQSQDLLSPRRLDGMDFPLTAAGKAFGSGTHSTTRLLLTGLETHLKPGDTVIDIGTGTGIVSIAAAKMGARSVLAVDVDPDAAKIAHRNVALNHLQATIQVEVGSLDVIREAQRQGHFDSADLIVAGITTPVVIDLLRSGLCDALAPGGGMILTGISHEQKREKIVREAMHAAGLVNSQPVFMNNWVALYGQKPNNNQN